MFQLFHTQLCFFHVQSLTQFSQLFSAFSDFFFIFFKFNNHVTSPFFIGPKR